MEDIPNGVVGVFAAELVVEVLKYRLAHVHGQLLGVTENRVREKLHGNRAATLTHVVVSLNTYFLI